MKGKGGHTDVETEERQTCIQGDMIHTCTLVAYMYIGNLVALLSWRHGL